MGLEYVMRCKKCGEFVGQGGASPHAMFHGVVITDTAVLEENFEFYSYRNARKAG